MLRRLCSSHLRPLPCGPAHALACLLLAIAFTALTSCSGPAPEVAIEVSEASREAGMLQSEPGDWPWWRGPTGRNVMPVDSPAPPVEWDENQHILWKTEVSGEGHASPILCGPRLFLASSDPQKESMWLTTVDAEEGGKLWETELHSGNFMHTHSKNSHASATPACDGERVYAVFMVNDGIWVSAVSVEGVLLWQKKAGPFRSKHGYGSSPLLFKSLVIVAGDNSGGSFLAALDRETGELAWRVARERNASFATPAIVEVEGEPRLILTGHGKVEAYDPHNGDSLWSAEGPATTTANTPAWNDELLFVSGGYPERSLMALDLNGTGRVAWSHRYKAYVPSPLVGNGRVYFVQDNGIVRCLEPATGKPIWTQRLAGNFSASPTLAGDRIYLPNEAGTVYVFRDADEFELLAENELDSSGGFASPVIARGRVYLRTRDAIYAIGTRSTSASETPQP